MLIVENLENIFNCFKSLVILVFSGHFCFVHSFDLSQDFVLFNMSCIFSRAVQNSVNILISRVATPSLISPLLYVRHLFQRYK